MVYISYYHPLLLRPMEAISAVRVAEYLGEHCCSVTTVHIKPGSLPKLSGLEPGRDMEGDLCKKKLRFYWKLL